MEQQLPELVEDEDQEHAARVGLAEVVVVAAAPAGVGVERRRQPELALERVGGGCGVDARWYGGT